MKTSPSLPFGSVHILLGVLASLGALASSACSTGDAVPCALQADCARYGASCIERQCRDSAAPDRSLPEPISAAPPPDLAQASSADPDLALACGPKRSCSGGFPICGVDQVCRACLAVDRPSCAAANLFAPRCDEGSGACSACRSDAAHESLDCPEAAGGVCGSDGSCRQSCSQHSDCASGLCDPGFVASARATCARPEEILHVRPVAGCAGPHAGSALDPLCEIDDAVALRPQGGYIRVLAGDTNLGRIKTPIARPYVIFGEGVLSAPNEQVGGVTALHAAASVVAGGRLYLEGLRVETTGSAGLTCDGGAAGASLVLRAVDFVAAQSVAVRAKACDVDLDRVRMREGGDGLMHDGGRLRVTNVFIYRNAGVAITTSTATTAELVAHLTVADNSPVNSSRPGAFACGGAMTVRNSIVWGNRVAGGLSYSGACAFRHSSVDPALPSTDGNNHLQPAFAPGNFQLGIPTDYHLKGLLPLGTNACCISQAEPLSEVRWDWDGQPRPNGLPDIGADEL